MTPVNIICSVYMLKVAEDWCGSRNDNIIEMTEQILYEESGTDWG